MAESRPSVKKNAERREAESARRRARIDQLRPRALDPEGKQRAREPVPAPEAQRAATTEAQHPAVSDTQQTTAFEARRSAASDAQQDMVADTQRPVAADAQRLASTESRHPVATSVVSPVAQGPAARTPSASARRSVKKRPVKPSADTLLMKLSLGGFAIIMAAGLVVGLSFPIRPTVSQLENRVLTPFPEVTVEGVMNGSFFEELSTWYSDTYPFRDRLVAASRSLQSLFGIQPEAQVIGQSQKADEIPDEGQVVQKEADTTKEVEVPTEEAMAEEIQGNIMGRLYVEGDAAYSVYYFSQESVQSYAEAINIAAKRLEGFATVYSMVVPNNSAVMLGEGTLDALGGTDQAQAIRYFYSLYDPLVRSVNVMDPLRSGNSSYIYFRADHHWTADGAYLAYVQYCSQAGLTPVDRDSLESRTFEPFLGTYYTQLGLQAMADNPDYVKAYYPKGTNILLYWDQSGNEIEGKVIQDVDGWADSSLYNTFICGDQPLAHIYNPEFDDDSSVLLVKDSFGCAFAPWLVNNYQNVWILDFRYSSTNIVDFAKENGIKNVIFLNNIEIAGTTTVANMITSLVTE